MTADLDYARIIALSKKDRPGLILFRAGNITDAEMIALIGRALHEVSPDQLPRSVVVVDEYSIRIASLPLKSHV